MDVANVVSGLRWPLEVVALLAALVPLMIVLRCWPTLPDQVPAHFGITGRPDRWGGRWNVWVLPILSIAIYVLLSGVGGTWNWLTGHPVSWDGGRAIVILIKPMNGIVMGYITWGIVRVARREAEKLNPWILIGVLALTLAPILVLVAAKKT
jgi:uncharacterized membrane protein